MDWLFQYTDPSIDWDYAMSTLVVRFIGVFVVMGIVQVTLQGASRLIGAFEGRAAERSSHPADDVAVAAPAGPGLSTPAEAQAGVDDATAAAIGLALALEAGAANPRVASVSGSSSAWAMAGRLRNLRR